MDFLFSNIRGLAKKNPEIYNFDGQKFIVDHIKKTVWTEIRTASSSMHKHVLEIGVNTGGINLVLATGFTLEIHLLENNKTYSITANELTDYKRTNETAFLVNGIVLNVFPLLIFHEGVQQS